MTIETSISRSTDEGLTLSGYALTDLMRHASFAECVFLLLAGRRPTPAQAKMTDAILVSCADHGINAPSAHVARASASCGVPLATAVAAGIASIGTNHGGAGEACARLLQDGVLSGSSDPAVMAEKILSDVLGPGAARASGAASAGRNLPGYGHRVYKDEDPRATCLLSMASELGLSGKHSALARVLEARLETRKGKRLVLNVDGAHAAILSDMGLPWNRIQPFFIIGRSLGLCAQVLEELESAHPLAYVKSVPAKESYVGPDDREWRTE
ncbi:MAG: citryl-CoA lyase [Spirochaetes bacterium]|nr:citryl-CoA lyase [Spirochaetota bacterium]